MDNSRFEQFVKGRKVNAIKENRNVWCYTRVSSKDQYVNQSLSNQTKSATEFAKKNDYAITKTFGGTYESASGDFTRKEFMKLLEEVRMAKIKPFAILIFKTSRFSRTGGGGIALANELIENLNVNLIEISTGFSTITERGKIDIYQGLLEARKETINKLEITVPGMKSHLQNGLRLGKAPRGYDHYGKRVKDLTKISETQRITINAEGKLLRKAWEWKATGEKDYQIIIRLKALGLKISSQTLSSMWRNTFYCGISIHKMLEGEIIDGKWEKMVSKETFLKVQEILKVNKQGYKVKNDKNIYPLAHHLYCIKCENKLVGYTVKKKNVIYYKCQKCKGVSINANKTKRSLKISAHELYVNLLKTYQLNPKLIEPLIRQLKKTFNHFNNSNSEEKVSLTINLKDAQDAIKKIKIRFAEGEIPEDVYLEGIGLRKSSLLVIQERLNELEQNISNLDKYINYSLQLIEKLPEYWRLGEHSLKKGIQDLVFPSGVLYDSEKREYLTKEVNEFFFATHSISENLPDAKRGQNRKNIGSSSVVAGTGFEPVTFGL